ncbi:MAG: dihydrofolate reductase [Gammaproteobacteria bacterium]|nr:dihydrofolate reductase [Gammaproteobacteria bacterium]
MTISIIAAMGKHREIGYQNELLWRLPNDMKFFRAMTMGKPILVGRKTFESFGGKPLPGRTNIVITQDQSYQCDGVVIVHSVEEALSAGKKAAEASDEIMIIGGASFYEQLLPLADRLYLTYVDGTFTADSWFPEFDKTQWQITKRESHEADEKNPYDHEFVIYDRLTD